MWSPKDSPVLRGSRSHARVFVLERTAVVGLAAPPRLPPLRSLASRKRGRWILGLFAAAVMLAGGWTSADAAPGPATGGRRPPVDSASGSTPASFLPTEVRWRPAAGPASGMRAPDPRERLRVLTKIDRPAARELRRRREGAEGGRRGEIPRTPGRAGETDYDLRHVRLEIDLTDYAIEEVRGVATQVVTSRVGQLSEVVLDLSGQLVTDSVRVGTASVAFTHSGDLLKVPLPVPLAPGQSATIRVVYHGRPPQDLGYGMVFQYYREHPFIWTLSEPDGGRLWWPCKDRPDDKADSSDVLITVPEFLTATSNGLLRSVVPRGDGATTWWWHHSYPIVPYLISVTAGVFARLTDSYDLPGGGRLPIEHFVFPDQVAAAETDFSINGSAFDAFTRRFGPYPFLREKYGVTVFGMTGGMEHQTNTSYGRLLITGRHSFDYVYVHELAHMWWGDEVTCATWADIWLNEGFASFAEALWHEEMEGVEAYRDYMTRTQFVFDPSGPLYDFPELFDGNTIYNKGAWVVHMLRGVLGDSLFFRGLADYRALFAHRSVTTAQFQEVMEASSGRDLDWFFQQWVYGPNGPEYRYSTFFEGAGVGTRVYVHLEQTQTDAPYFSMPVRIRVGAGADSQEVVFWNDPDHEDLWFEVPQEMPPSYRVKIDPDYWILRETVYRDGSWVLVEPDSAAYGLNLLSAEVDTAFADSAVAVSLLARGGALPYRWLAVDPPPFGVTLDEAEGVLAGSPTQAGDYVFRVRVTDSSVPPLTDTQRLTWTILPSDSSETPPPVFAGMRAVPNPTIRSVLLYMQAGQADGPARWSVFDPAGRLVARGESPGPTGDGTLRSWLWDGHDLDGRRAPAGVYLVRAEVPRVGRVVTGRVVRLR